MLSNYDAFHLPPPKDQENRSQPQRDATQHIDAEFVSITPVQPRWKHAEMDRTLQVDTLEQHMGICLAWEGVTILEVTTCRRPAGTSLQLKINRLTQWTDGFAPADVSYQLSLDAFEAAVRGEQWAANILRIVHREDDAAWWHVQERMWRDKLRDPFKMGWKVSEPVEEMTPRHTSASEPVAGLQELGRITKRKIPWLTDGQVEKELQPVVKRKRRLPWTTDGPAAKGRKSKSAKEGYDKSKQVDTLSAWFRRRGEIDPDDEEVAAVKAEGERSME